ncbi:tetratricopeptide repeat protein [Microcoleus sp.]|uniref:tetratricopeptide repeat protein n=1 Tax=Microcoleus sp. TaxID=44472 RepID=UPI00403E9F64
MNFSQKFPLALISVVATRAIAQPTPVVAISAWEVGKATKSIAVFNLGSPINTSLRLLASAQVNVGPKVPRASVATEPKAEDFLIQGEEKYEKGDNQGAVQAFNQAIKLNPNYTEAYGNRGIARYRLGDKQGAVADFNQALQINPNYANAYNNRANARSDLGDKQRCCSGFQPSCAN